MTTTDTRPLTVNQRALTESSGELAALSDCLRLEANEEEAQPDDFRLLLAETLKRISVRLWGLVEDVQ